MESLDRVVGEESAEHRPPTLSWAECTWQGQVCLFTSDSRPHTGSGLECSSASMLGVDRWVSR